MTFFLTVLNVLTVGDVVSELIITAGGENIAPVPIEDAIKEELSIISNVMAIGDKRKFLSCFVTLKVSCLKMIILNGYSCVKEYINDECKCCFGGSKHRELSNDDGSGNENIT